MMFSQLHLFDILVQMGLPDARKDAAFRKYILQEINKIENAGNVSDDDGIEAVPQFTPQEIEKAWKLANSDHAGSATRNQATNYLIDAYERGHKVP